jgi:hypothetical protein
MVFNLEPMIFPPGNVGGEFVREVLFAGLLTQLDAGAPYNRKFFRGGLWLDAEEEAEKIPVGLDSEEGFTEMDKNRNMANRIWVEVMELKAVIIKKAAEERTRGEGQSPFGKMVKYDDFIDIFHRERFTVRGVPIDKILVLQQPLGYKSVKIVEGTLTVCPLPDRWLRLLLLPFCF